MCKECRSVMLPCLSRNVELLWLHSKLLTAVFAALSVGSGAEHSRLADSGIKAAAGGVLRLYCDCLQRPLCVRLVADSNIHNQHLKMCVDSLPNSCNVLPNKGAQSLREALRRTRHGVGLSISVRSVRSSETAAQTKCDCLADLSDDSSCFCRFCGFGVYRADYRVDSASTDDRFGTTVRTQDVPLPASVRLTPDLLLNAGR